VVLNVEECGSHRLSGPAERAARIFLMLGCSNNNYAYSAVEEKCAEHRCWINDRQM